MNFSIGFEKAIIYEEQSTATESYRCELALEDLRSLTAIFIFVSLKMNVGKLKVQELKDVVYNYDCSKKLSFPYTEWIDYFSGKTMEPPSENNSIRIIKFVLNRYTYVDSAAND